MWQLLLTTSFKSWLIIYKHFSCSQNKIIIFICYKAIKKKSKSTLKNGLEPKGQLRGCTLHQFSQITDSI